MEFLHLGLDEPLEAIDARFEFLLVVVRLHLEVVLEAIDLEVEAPVEVLEAFRGGGMGMAEAIFDPFVDLSEPLVDPIEERLERPGGLFPHPVDFLGDPSFEVRDLSSGRLPDLLESPFQPRLMGGEFFRILPDPFDLLA